jgi:glycosyltransferase involved in cell wall biosynthesis
MRIVIDLQGAQSNSRFRGIGRYSLAFAQGIIQNRGDHEIILVLNGILRETVQPIIDFFSPILPRENIRIWYAPGPVMEYRAGTELRRESAELIREAFIASLNPDLIHISSLFEGYGDNTVTSIGRFSSDTPVSVSFYDLIPFLNPEEYLSKSIRYKNNYLRKIDDLKKSSLLLAISDFSKSEAIEHLNMPEQKVINVSSAADPFFNDQAPSEDPKALFEKLKITKPFILYTGGADPRKNLKSLLIAFARLPLEIRQMHQLVLSGVIAKEEMPKLLETIGKNGLTLDDVLFTSYITDKELHTLYFTCKLFVFPSWHEGFGLPALEAMKSGAAVIASNTTSLPEVIDIKEALFDPHSIDSILEKMQKALSDEQFRLELKRHAKEKSQHFSWDITAKKAMVAINSLLANRSAPLQKNTMSVIRARLLEQLEKQVFPAHSPQEEDLLRLSACIAQNFPDENTKLQLLVDVSQLVIVDSKTGIQRVVRSLITELLNHPPAAYRVRLVYADRFTLGYRYANRFTKRFMGGDKYEQQDQDSALEDFAIETQPGDIFLGLDLQSENIQKQKQFLNALHLNGTKVYFVVYDLLPLFFPHAFPETVDRLHAEWLKQISKYDGIFCISKAVADDFSIWAKENVPNLSSSFEVNWFHLGADIENSAPTKGMPEGAEKILEKISSRPSFVAIGTIEPRKGYPQMLKAFDLLWAKGLDINFVIIGKHGWLMDDFARNLPAHPEFNRHLFWLDGISDEYLENVYQASTSMLLASEGEGFGLPLIEAASRQVPIIARDIPVFREVAGNAAHYFTGSTPEELAQAIEAWLELHSKGAHPRSETMKWLTWKESTESLLKNLLHSE